MTALWVALAILAALLLLYVGVTVEYDSGGARVFLRVFALKIKVFPFPEKSEKDKKKAAEKAAKKAKSAKKEKKEPEKPLGKKHSFPVGIPQLIVLALRSVGRLWRRLKMEELKLRYTAASEDAAAAAVSYGRCCAAVGALTPLLENKFKIGKKDIAVSLDFGITKAQIEFAATIRIFVGELLFVAFAFAFGFLAEIIKSRREAKAAEAAEAVGNA